MAATARAAALSAVDRIFQSRPVASTGKVPARIGDINHELPVLRAVESIARSTLAGSTARPANASAKEVKQSGVVPINAKGIIGRTDAHVGLGPVHVPQEESLVTGRKRSRGSAGAENPAQLFDYATSMGIDAPAVKGAQVPSSKRKRVHDAAAAAGTAGGGAVSSGDGSSAAAGAGGAEAEFLAGPSTSMSTTAVTSGPVARALAAAAPLLASELGDKGVTAAKVYDADSHRKKHVSMSERGDLGRKWFNMPATQVTTELKRDLLLLRHRGYLDPKHHYKGGGVDGSVMELPRFFQVGTVQEGAHERLSRDARLTRKERKSTLVEAMLADERLRQYARRNAIEASTKGSAGGKAAYRQRKAGAAPKGMRAATHDRAFRNSRKQKGR